MVSHIYTNLPVNIKVRLPHPQGGDSQDQETFLAPFTDNQTRNYDAKCSNHHPSLSLSIIHIYIYIFIYNIYMQYIYIFIYNIYIYNIYIYIYMYIMIATDVIGQPE